MLNEFKPENTSDVVYPCPFSAGYGIPLRQARLLLKVFLIYRLILACLFLMLFYSRIGPGPGDRHDEYLFIASGGLHLILTAVSGFCLLRRLLSYTVLAQTLIFTDIIVITLIMHACGGINSGVGILLAASIAASGLLIGGRCALLFAAIASLAILSEQIYAFQTHSFRDSAYTYAAMLGASFFTIAMLSYALAQRTEQSTEQLKTINQLEELSRNIIQHLQTGIIIADHDAGIRMSNEAALRLTQLSAIPCRLDDISPFLSEAFSLWLNDSSQDFAVIPLANNTEMQTRFTSLPTRHEALNMIILEDVAFYNQRLQQSKLASLGQLTASIAHEIRNPLGAISHAGQLLAENPELTAEDRRLTEIIKDHSTRVNKIIEDILQLSKRNASLRIKIDLHRWIVEYAERFCAENGLPETLFIVKTESDRCHVLADQGHLKQILDNLCHNALKYGGAGNNPITLAIRLNEQIPCIEVIDSGPGIEPENQKHLFEPFFTTSKQGTGLGLYISRELAELNQARLSYQITDKGLSCFRLCLPNAEQTLIEL